ncbi:MAG: V-type ATP synthase subunit I [Thermodesulfobacteriota bacterium]
MATASMKKIGIIAHEVEKVKLIESLQLLGVVQVSNLKEEPYYKESLQDYMTTKEVADTELVETLSGLNFAINYLTPFEPKKGAAAGLLQFKIVLNNKEHENILKYDYRKVIKECQKMDKEMKALSSQENRLQGLTDQLHPWANLDTPLEELISTNMVDIHLGMVPIPCLEEMGKIDHAIEVDIVNKTEDLAYVIVIYLKEDAERVAEYLKEWDFVYVTMPEDVTGKVEEVLIKMREDLSEIQQKKERLKEKSKGFVEAMPKLKVLHDYYSNLLSQKRIEGSFVRTSYSLFLEGWVKAVDFPLLKAKLEDRFKCIKVMEVEPIPDEVPPVDLENKGIFKPFEMVTELYGMPHHATVDPSPILAPFFAIFFGLCLTDAGYGIILAILSYILLKKLQPGAGGRKLLGVLFIGGISTIIMGALTGGWFGDIIDRQPFAVLVNLRDSMQIFDPMKTPLLFFVIALVLGYIQISFGLLVKTHHMIKQGRVVDAFGENISWLVLISALILWGVGGYGLVPASLVPLAKWVSLIAALAVVLSSGKGVKNPFARLAAGLYGLYGVTGYLSDLLSYLRLVALGMATAGIAVVTNVMAFMASDIPYIGFIFFIIVMLIGHIFNILVNALGAFVHSARLQYVEFFPKFFEGGGKKFQPFKREMQHTVVID